MLQIEYPIVGRWAQDAQIKRILSCDEDKWYDMLGVNDMCTTAEAHAAYKRVALAVHPDKNLENTDAAAAFKRKFDASRSATANKMKVWAVQLSI
jgi:hypothetical protein